VKDKEKTKGELLSESEELHQELDRKRESEVQPKLLEKTLLGSEENLSSILRLTSDMVFVIDPDGVFKSYHHPSSGEDLYVPPEEFLGRHFNHVLPPHVAQMLEQAINEVKTTGQTQQFDYPLDIKGSVLWYNARVSSFRYQPEGTPAILVAVRNITERKRAEEKHKRVEQEKATILNSMLEHVVYQDKEMRILWANKAAGESVSIDSRELVGRHCYEVWQRRNEPCENCPVMEAISTGQPHQAEMTTADGKSWFIRGHPVRDSKGHIVGAVEITLDITQRKKMEEAYRALVENSLQGLGIAQDNKVAFVNSTIAEMLGYSIEELMSFSPKDWKALIHPQDLAFVWERFLNRSQGKSVPSRYELRMVRKDGEVIWVELFSNCIKYRGKPAIQAAFVDITERKRIEEKLRSVEQEKTTILNSMTEHVVYYDKEIRILWANKAAGESAGLPAEEMAGRHCYEVWRQKSKPCINCPVIEAIKTGKPHQAELTNKDGRIWFVKAHPVRNSNGGIAGAVEITLDITQRKKVEEVLKQSERDYRELFESAHDAILILDPEREIVLDVNQRACTMYGFDRSEFIGMSLETISKDVTRGRKHIKVALDKGFYHHFETCQYRKDGTEILLEINASVVEYKGKRTILSINRDITERKKMQEELLKARKLESIGILAGGIAHDFNNILTGILGNISVAKAKLDSEDEVFRILVKAEKASLRAKDLTQQLFTFSMGGAPIKETTSIGELIEDSVDFVLRGSNVRCEFSLPDGLWPVEIDKGQINQVLNNLIINADQSMPDGGLIKVSAENISLSAKDILPLKKGKYVKITIADRGMGIPKQHLQKIFDPYFTTKKKGDGLGLATSYSIIKNHNGHIQVESELGAGSTLIIYLPASCKKIPKTP
jgi:PAS domain S-box-containing protein